MKTTKQEGTERFRFNGNNDDFWASAKWNAPKTLWIVQIPKGGEFHMHHTKHINWWARVWMRFIGWGVIKSEHKDND